MLFVPDVQLQKNFTLNEFVHASDSVVPNEQIKYNIYRLSEVAQRARDIINTKRFRVTSGYRSVGFNTKVGGDRNSYHLNGLAMDFELLNIAGAEDYSGWSIEALQAVFNYAGFKNVGIYVKKGTRNIQWIHADIGHVRFGQRTWNKYSDTMAVRIVEV